MAIESVLLVGATGHLGRHFVSALQKRKKKVHALVRPETARSTDPAKKGLVDDFKQQGVNIIEGTVEDSASLERACAQADAVISLISGPSLAQQVNLAPAAKKSGRVRRIFPSEFGIDPKLAGQGSVALLDWKAAQHDAFNKTGVAITYF